MKETCPPDVRCRSVTLTSSVQVDAAVTRHLDEDIDS